MAVKGDRDEEIFQMSMKHGKRGDLLTIENSLFVCRQTQNTPPKNVIGLPRCSFTLHTWLKKIPFLFLSALVMLAFYEELLLAHHAIFTLQDCMMCPKDCMYGGGVLSHTLAVYN